MTFEGASSNSYVGSPLSTMVFVIIHRDRSSPFVQPSPIINSHKRTVDNEVFPNQREQIADAHCAERRTSRYSWPDPNET